MRIKLDAFNPVESLDQSVATPHSTDEQRPSNSPCECVINYLNSTNDSYCKKHQCMVFRFYSRTL